MALNHEALHWNFLPGFQVQRPNREMYDLCFYFQMKDSLSSKILPSPCRYIISERLTRKIRSTIIPNISACMNHRSPYWTILLQQYRHPVPSCASTLNHCNKARTTPLFSLSALLLAVYSWAKYKFAPLIFFLLLSNAISYVSYLLILFVID